MKQKNVGLEAIEQACVEVWERTPCGDHGDRLMMHPTTRRDLEYVAGKRFSLFVSKKNPKPITIELATGVFEVHTDRRIPRDVIIIRQDGQYLGRIDNFTI